MNPWRLEAYNSAEKLKDEKRDTQMWMMGAYVSNAVGVAVSNALNGKKSRAKYLEKPFSAMEREERERTPEDELLRFSAWAAVWNENFIKTHEGQG